MSAKNSDVDKILKKYGSKIEGKINSSNVGDKNYSRSYVKFKEEMAPELTKYEKWCHTLGNIIKIKVSEKDKQRVEKHLKIAHLDVEPWQALTLGIMTFISVFFIGLLGSFAIAFIQAEGDSLIAGILGAFPFIFFVLMVILAIFLFYFVNNYPARLANKWRLKASSQMVPAILYVVVYMRHTANLERAISFAAEHLQPPLSLDFKKVFYDVEVGKFSTIKESLDNYLETWRDYSVEFIEAFHLIEGSLFEPDNSRRISTLEKALQVVLDGVYEKMLKFTHKVRSPLTNVYMLTVVLPVLGIALLPLASAMVGDYLKWQHVFILYTLILPFVTFYLTDKILLMRPGGHGESGLLERNPSYFKYKSKKPYYTAFLICLPFLILGLLPLIFQYTPLPDLLGIPQDFMFSEIGLSFLGANDFVFDFKENGAGPFGTGALILSMFIPLGLALFFSIAHKQRTKDLMKERENTKQLEEEFNTSLFQLGNRLGNGVPPELVFGKVAESSKGLKTEDFFKRVNYNIRQGGMSISKALFDPRRGAIIYYPSELISTSMKVLVDSVKKGLKIAAVSLMSISEYVKNIHKITSRLRDLLAEIVSDMKSNMTFLAPLLSGIVVGLAAMITTILNKLDFEKLAASGSDLGSFDQILTIFNLEKMIPPYYLQIAIGIYLVEIIFILTATLVVINSGQDKLEKTNKIGINLKRGVLLYFIVAFLATLVLSILATVVIPVY